MENNINNNKKTTIDFTKPGIREENKSAYEEGFKAMTQLTPIVRHLQDAIGVLTETEFLMLRDHAKGTNHGSYFERMINNINQTIKDKEAALGLTPKKKEEIKGI